MTAPSPAYAAPGLHKIPPLILVLSIITIGWSLFGIICGVLYAVLSLFTNALSFLSFGAPNPAADILRDDTLARAVTVVTVTLNFFMFLFAILASIGSLKLRPWGRYAMIIFALWLTFSTFLSCLFNAIYMGPRIATLTDVRTPGTYGFNLAISLASTLLGFLFVLAYAAFILYAFNTRKSRNAFQGIFASDEHPDIPPDLQNSPLI